MALVPSAPASNHCRGMEPPRPLQYPWASPRISARVRCSTSATAGVTRAFRGSAPLGPGGRALGGDRVGEEVVVPPVRAVDGIGGAQAHDRADRAALLADGGVRGAVHETLA